MVFHLDKCIGCHTCSIACKNIWTDRKGTEYMWWNNVETKPGTGYPTAVGGPGEVQGRLGDARTASCELKSTGKAKTRLQHLPQPASCPRMDDYYEPWTYDYQDLFNAPAGRRPADRPADLDGDRRADRHRSRAELGRRPRRLADLRGERSQPERPDAEDTQQQLHGRRAAGLLLLPAHLQPLPESVLRGGMPVGRALQARRGRHRAGRPEALPRLARVRRGLPLQEDVLTTGTPANRRSAFSASRASRPARRRRASIPASGASATSACCSTTPSRIEEVAKLPDDRTDRRPALADPRSERSRR